MNEMVTESESRDENFWWKIKELNVDDPNAAFVFFFFARIFLSHFGKGRRQRKLKKGLFKGRLSPDQRSDHFLCHGLIFWSCVHVLDNCKRCAMENLITNWNCLDIFPYECMELAKKRRNRSPTPHSLRQTNPMKSLPVKGLRMLVQPDGMG